MPHCIIEYAKPLEDRLDPTKLVQTVYEGAYSSGLFEGPDIKTRAIAYGEYLTGTDKAAFIHVTVKILKGRTDEQKQRLSSTVIKSLISLQLSDISITVDIVDMESKSYAKHLT